MISEAILLMVFNIVIVITLYFASKEDMKYHRIDKKYVSIIFLSVLIYTLLSSAYVVERTFSLLITLGIFSFFTFTTKGGFGFGDTLILAALGWYIGSLYHLSYFYIILAFITMGWGAYHILKNRKENKILLKDYFKTTEVVSIDNVKPGMILAKDYFMKGLTETEIEKLKNDGMVTLSIKQAYPFIPVILASFLTYIFLNVYF